MKKFVVLVCLASLATVAVAQVPAPPKPGIEATPAQVPAPPTPGGVAPLPAPAPVKAAAPVVDESVAQPAFETFVSTADLGTFFYLAKRKFQFQRGVGHAPALGLLATCGGLGGTFDDKLQAFATMHAALMTVGPVVYRGGVFAVTGANGQTVQVRTQPVLQSNPTMSQIVAVLTCKQGDRSAEGEVKLLNAAFDAMLASQTIDPDTQETIRWRPDLATLLMTAIVLQ